MTSDNDPAAETTIFSAVLTPNRSLGGAGFVALMAAVSGVSFIAGLAFLLAGAWPVFGFFGFDVVLIYWAFRASYRSGRAYEQVIVSATELKVRKVTHRGEMQEWTLNPLWVRLKREDDEEFGLQRLSLASRGRELPIANCLAPMERESFASALADALGEARNGPRRAP